MTQKIVAIAVAASALLIAGAPAHAARVSDPAGLYHQVATLMSPLGDQREVIAPPSDVDRDMAITPPATGARMPIIEPRELPGGRFGIVR